MALDATESARLFAFKLTAASSNMVIMQPRTLNSVWSRGLEKPARFVLDTVVFVTMQDSFVLLTTMADYLLNGRHFK